MCSMALKLAMQFHNLFNYSNTDCLIPFYSNLCKFHSKLNNLPATNIKCKMRKYESSFPEFLLMILSMSNSTKEKKPAYEAASNEIWVFFPCSAMLCVQTCTNLQTKFALCFHNFGTSHDLCIDLLAYISISWIHH